MRNVTVISKYTKYTHSTMRINFILCYRKGVIPIKYEAGVKIINQTFGSKHFDELLNNLSDKSIENYRALKK